jgi:hypothetical protein
MVSWTRLYVTWYVHFLSGQILLPKGRSDLGLYNSYRRCFQGVKCRGRSVYHPPSSIAEAETGKGHTGITTTPGVPTLPWYTATFTLCHITAFRNAPRHRRLVAGFSPRKSAFDARTDHVRNPVTKWQSGFSMSTSVFHCHDPYSIAPLAH